MHYLTHIVTQQKNKTISAFVFDIFIGVFIYCIFTVLKCLRECVISLDCRFNENNDNMPS